MLADFSQKKPGRGCCMFVRCLRERPFGVTSEERELGAERAGDAGAERMENAGRGGHLKASNK